MTGPVEILRRLEQAGPADRELLARFVRQRDQSAFAELVRRHGPVVFGVCRRVTGHPQDAEDAFQAVFLVLACKAAAVGKPDLLGNWLYGVAVRVARKARRSAARRHAREVAVAIMPDPPAMPAPTFTELGPILDEELAALPAWYREAIVLCDLRGVSREEAALLLGVPEGTLSSRLANGRKKLATRLKKRGIALSAAAMPATLAETQAVTVPGELIAKTCGLVADWSAGIPVPGPLARLAKGGLIVRKTLLGVMTATIVVAGAVFAARSGDGPPVPAAVPKQQPPVVAVKGDPPAELKRDGKPGDKLAFTTSPKMRAGRDSHVTSVTRLVWSPDGNQLAHQGKWLGKGTNASAGNTISVDGNFADPDGFSTRIPIGKNQNLVGFTSDGKYLITDQREYNLVSGFHRLIYTSLNEQAVNPGGAGRGEWLTKDVNLDNGDTHGYAFAADSKTFRTVSVDIAKQTGLYRKITVTSVDAVNGKTLKTLMTAEGKFQQYALSPDGKLLGVIDPQLSGVVEQKQSVTVYDVDSGKSLWTKPLKFEKLQPDTIQLEFSPGNKRLAVLGDVAIPLLFDAATGDSLPKLEGAEYISPKRASFSANGRLLAVSGEYMIVTTTKVGGRDVLSLNAGSSFLSVWDTETGKVLKSWDRAAWPAFNPVKPILAILEPNGEGASRIGLWDFAAEVEKK